ncbi:alpha/beta-hydrolase [Penicillium sp. IBT 16267x]|nr:alpha/beta-hydrolase [Penicillium sp. IBT 16267x]
MRMISRFVTSADGTQIWAEETGDHTKPAIVFLPGFGFSSVAFEKQFDDLSLQEYHLVRYDCRGHARSDQPTTADAYTSKCMAEDFQAVCELLDITKPVLAGWSFGGTISSDICENLGANYLSGTIYLSGIPYFSCFQEVGTKLMGPTFQTLANPNASAIELAEAIVFLVDSCVADGYDISTEKKWLWRGIICSQNPHVRPLIISKEQDTANILATGAKLPICIIQGTKDKHLDVRKVEKFAREKFGQVEFHALDDAGHMCFYECPEKTNQLILEFMRRI